MPLGSIGAANSQALVATVKATKFSFGYADLSDAVTSNVPFATIKNANGEWIAPTTTASSLFLESFSGASGFNATTGALTLNFTKKIAGAYNMSLVTYAIVDKASSSAKAIQVEAFVKYMLNTCGPAKGAELGYAPISGALLTKANAIAEGIS
jgi:phosphate transport system substrate-binding protein